MTTVIIRNKLIKSQVKVKNEKYQIKTSKTHKKWYRFVWILTFFVTNPILFRNLNCKGRSLYKYMRTCLQMPKFIALIDEYKGIIAMRDNLRIFDDLDDSESAFYLYFPLSRALKSYGCPLESKSLAFLSNIFTLRVSLLCGDTETQPCLVIYFVTFYFYSTKQHEH